MHFTAQQSHHHFSQSSSHARLNSSNTAKTSSIHAADAAVHDSLRPSRAGSSVGLLLPLQDEVLRLREKKRTEASKMADDSRWKESLRLQMEAEIERRVREALDTPPMERMQRARVEARRRAEDEERARLNNAHLRFDLSERDKAWLRQRRLRNAKQRSDPFLEIPGVPLGSLHGDPDAETIRANNRFEQWLTNAAGHLGSRSPPSPDDFGGRLGNKSVRFNDNIETFSHMRVGMDAMRHFGLLTEPEREFLYLNFTKSGFLEALRSGRLPDGTQITELPGHRYRDRYGIVRDKHGPFWPRDYGPLHPTPQHKRLATPEVEPLFNPMDLTREPARTFDTQNTPYDGRWRGVQIIYDSEKNSRKYEPPSVSENTCPSLIFESRFECGNLRQARRIGQFEYELVLQTDLYTKRHTQWFYFRVQNALPNITYKFIIINLLKRSSLYTDGMRPLFYSEKEAANKGVGWFRNGHHIRYSRNVTHLQCPLLQRELVYYQLEWQQEFLNEDDVCYIAHCYPYTYSDLKVDIDTILTDPMKRRVMSKEVLCETRAGNSCFVLTITDPDHPQDCKERKGVVVTARVHPGETNASWMMKGLIEYLTSVTAEAAELRRHFVFKVVPMLNPDGVIVGNYRCSLAARDLNRNYRHPRRETFPTVWSTKSMLEEFSKKYQVVLYCDMHGHSRKPNVFMYGCDSQYRNVENVNAFTPKFTKQHAESFLNERLFPWLMSRKAPDMFSFNGCKFNIRKCKEATGRVVMWRQMMIENSFTMEATFSGTTLDKSMARHFNTKDLIGLGSAFGQALLEYTKVNTNKEKQAEVIIDMTRTVMQQVLQARGFSPHLQIASPDSVSDEAPPTALTKALYNFSGMNGKNQNSGMDVNKALNIDNLIESVTIDSIDNYFKLLEQLNVNEMDESDSSDSDSESEPELPPPKSESKDKPKKKKKKMKRKDSDRKLKTSPLKNEKTSSALPTIPSSDLDSKRTKRKLEPGSAEARFAEGLKKASASLQPSFVSKYEGRSNGGIPCFAEERLLERAAKRLISLQKKNEEKRQKNLALYMRVVLEKLSANNTESHGELPPASYQHHRNIHSPQWSQSTAAEIDELRRKLNSVLRRAVNGEGELTDGLETPPELEEEDLRELYPILKDLANGSDDSSDDEFLSTNQIQVRQAMPKRLGESRSIMPQLQPSKFQNIKHAAHRRSSVVPIYAQPNDSSGVIYISSCVKNPSASAPSTLESNQMKSNNTLPTDPLQRRRTEISPYPYWHPMEPSYQTKDRITSLFQSQRPHFQSMNKR